MTAPKCKCSHTAATHGRDRMGRAICRSVACGCIAYRGASDPIPARLDERYDPSPEPIDRKTR